MSLPLDSVDVERMAEETDLNPDDIRAAFGVYGENDRDLLARLNRMHTFAEVLALYKEADPDTESAAYQLQQALVDMAMTYDELAQAVELNLPGRLDLPVRIKQQALERALNLTRDRNDLAEIAMITEDPSTAHRAIRLIAEQYRK